MLVGTLYLGYVFDVHHIMSFLNTSLIITLNRIFGTILKLGDRLVENDHSFFAGLYVYNILVSWFQSKMQLATEAIKFKLIH